MSFSQTHDTLCCFTKILNTEKTVPVFHPGPKDFRRTSGKKGSVDGGCSRACFFRESQASESCERATDVASHVPAHVHGPLGTAATNWRLTRRIGACQSVARCGAVSRCRTCFLVERLAMSKRYVPSLSIRFRCHHHRQQ